MFGLFRLIGIVVALAVAAVIFEPSWDGDQRALTLRVRSARECIEVVRALGDRVSGDRVAKKSKKDRKQARGVEGGGDPPPVAAGPVALDEKPQERLTEHEREVLDRLIEEKTREE